MYPRIHILILAATTACAAEDGLSPIAVCHYAELIEDGRGVRKDEKRALALYLKAKSRPRAMARIARMYEHGRGGLEEDTV